MPAADFIIEVGIKSLTRASLSYDFLQFPTGEIEEAWAMDTKILDRIACRIDRSADLPAILPIDKWLASSVTQKAVRRGDAEAAVRAALTYLAHDAASFWRRLPIIAFEDVGVGSPEALIDTVAAAASPGWRQTVGGDQLVARFLVDQMARSPKERSADYLICAAKGHPTLEGVRQECGLASVSDRLSIVSHPARSLADRAVAAWYSSGLDCRGEKRVGRGDLGGLLEVYRSLDVRSDLVEATGKAATQTREPLVLMLPLIWLAASEEHSVKPASPLPSTAEISGIPLYALDKHTRLGRQALAAFVAADTSLRATLGAYISDFRHRGAVEMAAFYVDAAPVSMRRRWRDCERLEAAGLESDMLSVGVPREGILPIVAAVQANIDHLNFYRHAALSRYLGHSSVAQARA